MTAKIDSAVIDIIFQVMMTLTVTEEKEKRQRNITS